MMMPTNMLPAPITDPDRDTIIMALVVYRERVRWYWPSRIVTTVEPVEVTQVQFVYSTGEIKPGNLDWPQFRSAVRYLLSGSLHA